MFNGFSVFIGFCDLLWLWWPKITTSHRKLRGDLCLRGLFLFCECYDERDKWTSGLQVPGQWFRDEIHDFYGYKKCSELRTSPKVVWRNKLQNLCQVLWQRWVPNFHLKWSLYSSGYAYSLPPRSGSKKNPAGCHFKVEECTGRSADSKVSGWQDSCQHTIQHQDFASRVHGIW